jgi:hypothetical protein
MSANPAITFSDLPSIEDLDLAFIVGGEGWGQWAGKYIGAGVGAAAGFGVGTAVGSPVAGAVAGGVLGAAGYDYGGQFGNWLTGGR